MLHKHIQTHTHTLTHKERGFLFKWKKSEVKWCLLNVDVEDECSVVRRNAKQALGIEFTLDSTWKGKIECTTWNVY
jgi:hypothetical protein